MAYRLKPDINFDNRDEHTTELVTTWIGDRVEVDPFEVFTNMLENCFPGPEDENPDETTYSSLQELFDLQKKIRQVIELYPGFTPAN